MLWQTNRRGLWSSRVSMASSTSAEGGVVPHRAVRLAPLVLGDVVDQVLRMVTEGKLCHARADARDVGMVAKGEDPGGGNPGREQCLNPRPLLGIFGP